MSDPLHAIRAWVRSPSDAIRWACILEATAPKVGNVFPGNPFEDLEYRDFIAAAELAAVELTASQHRVSERVLAAVRRGRAEIGSNANLGILLLLGPLVAADESMGVPAEGVDELHAWRDAIKDSVSGFDGADGRRIFQAIAESAAGGLGHVAKLDVNTSADAEIDLLEAMRLASDRDRIALQYASGFANLIEQVVPVVCESLHQAGDTLAGIAQAHLRLLAQAPDSLIGRKNGPEVASQIQTLASEIDPGDVEAVVALDARLRTVGHWLNPGTTADLIAAALYLLLRTRAPDPGSHPRDDP